MSTYLKNNQPRTATHIVEIINDNWDLDTQLQALENWLCENPDFCFTNGEWIADIGYDPRPDVTVAGYTVSLGLMSHLVKNNITLWISDYRGV